MAWAAVGAAAVSVVGSVAGGAMSKGSSSGSYSNPGLQSYTDSYSRMAPWTFATLDPTATMDYINQKQGGKNKNFSADYQANIKNMSDAEKRQASDTKMALDRIQARQSSGQFLTPQETEYINTNLDKAFEYAHTVGYADWEKGAQSLAGSRGLRTGDTPVAKPAMEELRNFELGLGSKRAELGLQATMQMGQSQQAFDASFAAFNQQLMEQKRSTRLGFLFGGGMGGVGGAGGSQAGSTTSTPSFFSGAGQGLDFGSKIGSMFMASKPAASVVPAGGGSNYGGAMGLSGSSVGNMFG